MEQSAYDIAALSVFSSPEYMCPSANLCLIFFDFRVCLEVKYGHCEVMFTSKSWPEYETDLISYWMSSIVERSSDRNIRFQAERQ